MKIQVDECVECGVLPCLGNSCPNRNVTHYLCDICKEEEQLYDFDGEELCIECIINKLDKVN